MLRPPAHVGLVAICAAKHARSEVELLASQLMFAPPFGKGRVESGIREACFAPMKRWSNAVGHAGCKSGGILNTVCGQTFRFRNIKQGRGVSSKNAANTPPDGDFVDRFSAR